MAPRSAGATTTYGQATVPAGIGSVTQITAGQYHTCAIKTDGTPVCWGYNAFGQTTIPAGICQRHADHRRRLPHVCDQVRRHPGLLGRQRYGQTTVPAGVGSVTQITAGGYHTCALRTDGAAVCWGHNGYGQSLVPPHSTARPVISGSPTVGSTLSASTGTWENAPTGYAYAWLRCSTNNTLASCSPIAGATQASYVVAAADDASWLRVVVTATNASGSVAQHSYAVRVPPRPLNTVRPQISGTFRVGSVVSATTGEWDNNPTGYAYAWQRCTTNNTSGVVHPDRRRHPGDLHAERRRRRLLDPGPGHGEQQRRVEEPLFVAERIRSSACARSTRCARSSAAVRRSARR